MNTLIATINASPVVYHGKSLTVQGVVRTICEAPFPHFTLEDKTGTLICQSMTELPGVGAHVQISGKFFVGIPENCTFQIPLLKEQTRSHLLHQRPCRQIGCDFEKEMPTGWAAFAA